jgi:DMSO/TMAO reductase YedYZ molybdopterin-dependent catalytic subunit
VAISFLGWKAAGLPFAPFDIFDWIVRLLPGAVVTFAIESSVAISRLAGVTNISVAAKAGDQVLAIAGLLAAGTLLGAVLFALLSRSDESATMFGGILGAMLGGLTLIVEQRLQRLPPGSIVSGAWVFATFVAWGLAFGSVYDRARAGRFIATRRILLATAIAAVAGVIAGRKRTAVSGRRWSDEHALPNAGASVTPVRGTRPEFTPIEDFYRIDTNTRAPAIDAARWRLAVTGLVDRPQTLTLADVRAFEPTDVFATLSCISNPPGGDLISTTRWTGVSLQRLLPRLALRPSATHLKITSADGFFEVVSLDTIRGEARAMLAYAWDGVPLPAEHGFPLRLYVPDVYGMKQPKWVTGIDALSRWEPGYWVARGWDREGRVVPTAAVDAVVRRGEVTEVGGIAYAGSRGIATVEVRGNDGEWQTAQIRQPLSDLTWVIWRAELRASGPYAARVVSSRA